MSSSAAGAGYEPAASGGGGGGGSRSSPNRSITTELTDLDSIQTLSLEDVEVPSPSANGRRHHGHHSRDHHGHHQSSSSSSRDHHGHHREHGHHPRRSTGREDEDAASEAGGGGCLKGLKHMAHKKHGGSHQGRAPRLPPGVPVSAHAPGGGILYPQSADPNLVISGHQDLNTLFASNDVRTAPITVNVCNAPNSSTVQCGCENVNCPFCNLMLSIEKTDPTVLQ